MQLLNELENQTTLLKADQSIDYQLVKAITQYLRKYSDKYHHPLENLIYAHYLKYRVVTEQVANRLMDDHKELKKLTAELDDMLDMILLDAIMPKEVLIEKLETFCRLQTQHLMYEEKEILPEIKRTLNEDDWAHLNLQWKHKSYKDPLFGQQVSQRFSALAEQLKLNLELVH